jgi:hypothetical protein
VATVDTTESSPTYKKKMTLTSNYTGSSGSYFAKYAISKYETKINSFYTGANYLTDDTVLITGDRLGGSTPTNDLTIHITETYSGKVVSAVAVTNIAHPAPTTGPIKTIITEGTALDSSFASLQGAVLPIKSETIANSAAVDHGVMQDELGNVIVRLDYTPSGLNPGQIQGSKTYFYHLELTPYVYNNPYLSDGVTSNPQYISTRATLEVHKPKFNPYNVTQSYFVKVINGGTEHHMGQSIFISGAELGGVAGVNDAYITVTAIGSVVGSISSVTVTGVSPRIFDIYYIQPVTLTEVQVFYDPGMKRPVRYDDFNYKNNSNLVDNTAINLITGEDATLLDYNLDTANISDFAYIPEPFTLGLSYKYDTSSIVSYANRIWRCIESNNDKEFDSNKWIELQSDDRSINALDRIVAYYEPAINMPAKDLHQLVGGISYPGTVYYGNSFSPEDIIPIDVNLKGQELYPRTLNIKGIITNTNQVLITGSLSLTHGSNNVTGNGTLFNKELSSGTKLYINGFEYIVDTVANNSSIILTSNYAESTKIASAYKFQYIAIAESTDKSILMTSTDGVTWQNHILAEHSLNVTSIIYGKDKYLVSTLSTNNPILLSYNGVDWLGQGQSTLLDQVGFDDDTFDSSPESYPMDSVNKVIQGSDGYYYGVGSFIARSAEGVVWDKQYTFGTKTRNIIYNISEVSTRGFNGFIAVGGGNKILSGIGTAAPEVTACSIVISSIDGVSWSLRDLFLSTETVKVIASNRDIIVIAGDNGKIWYSVNGYNWTQTISGVTHNLTAGAYVNSKFVLVGDHGTILTSTDGVTWTDKTDNTLTVDNLNDVTYDGTHYYIVGDNATIIRSSDTNVWTNISMLTPAEPDSIITGNDFLYGYGPEELVPGIITETLSLKVITSPGASWDETPLVPQQAYYQHTSFGMKSVTSTTGTVSFDKLLKNPAEVSVFIIDSTTKLGNRIYTGFTVNWITKVVTLTDSLPAGKLLMVEVYEIGNGKQLSRGNTQNIPLRIDPLTSNSQIYLNIPYTQLLNIPVVYHNGVKLMFETDYNYTFTDDTNESRIIFNTVYNQATDYVTWAILDTSISNFRPAESYAEILHSIPETQTFTNSTSKNKVLTNNIGKSNIANAIVEKNGLRLIPTTDYSITLSTKTLTLVSDISTSDIIAVTTFNETERLFIQTNTYTATSGQTVFAIAQPITNPNSVTHVNMDYIYYTDVNKAWVTINGKRIGSDKLSWTKNTGTKASNLTINATINSGDIVIVTVTLDGATPNSSIFNIDINKYGKPTIFRTNDGDGTWLTKDFNLGDTSVQVYDVNRLMDTVVQNITATVSTSGTIFAYVECDISTVMKSVVYNQTSSGVITKYVLDMVNGRPALVFANDAVVSSGDNLTVTLTVGNILELNGEKIRFNHVDFVTNTVSGLTRGILGTGSIEYNSKYTNIYGLTTSRILDPKYYGVVWNSSNYHADFGDPLQFSDTPAARFLQYGYY